MPIPICNRSKSEGTELRSAGSTQCCSQSRAGNLALQCHLSTLLPSNTGTLSGNRPVGLSSTHWCEDARAAHGSTGPRGSTLPLSRGEHQLPHTAFASCSPGHTAPSRARSPTCTARAPGRSSSAAQQRPSRGKATLPGPARAVLPALSSAQLSSAQRSRGWQRPAGIWELSTSPRSPADRHRGRRAAAQEGKQGRTFVLSHSATRSPLTARRIILHNYRHREAH